jgi:hypothetical protein
MDTTRLYQSLLLALTLSATGVAAQDSITAIPSAAQAARATTAESSFGASTTFDPLIPSLNLGAPLPCLTRLKDFGATVNFILVGTRNDGADANFARGTLSRSDFLTLAQFDSVDDDWLFASKVRCEDPTSVPGGFGSCGSLQPFSTSAPSRLEVSAREDGLVTLSEPNWPWSSDLHGQCMGDMLYGYNGLDMWILSFSAPAAPLH